jgi:photosystem II stability/assembly factor-like uncharacterized protein
MKQLNKIKTISTDIFFYLAILIFIIGFNFSDNMVTGWYQQFMPNLNGRNITDIFFFDSLTGWAVTNATNQNPDTIFVLKTSNSGDNWAIHFRKIQTGGGFPGYTRIYFLNQNTGFASSVTGFDKTTNGGVNWTPLITGTSFQDMRVLNTDTIWLASGDGLVGGVFRTTNGGANWTQQINLGNQNPDHIYMFNERIGFVGKNVFYSAMYKTTNSGENWFPLSDTGFTDMYFSDSLIGWKIKSYIKKTTNGGLNWFRQTLPYGGNIITPYSKKLSLINRDTLWANGGEILWNNGTQSRDILYRTINGGQNWLFQIPDTSMSFNNLSYIIFTNSFNGWSYALLPLGLHTTTGGDPLFYTSIKQISSKTPDAFKLEQNYPNPFNPSTKIKYEVRNQSSLGGSEVRLVVYDINAKEISTLVNKKQNAGIYEVSFDGTAYSSGIYFYSLYADGILIDTKKAILLK